MRPDLKFLRERFNYFNHQIFHGELPAVTLRISSSMRTMGTLRHPRYRRASDNPSEIILSISNRYDLGEKELEDTIIHEQIHLYIYWKGIRDTSVHGERFKQTMQYINSRYGRCISVKKKFDETLSATDRISKIRPAIITVTSTGEQTITVCSPRYLISIYGQIQRWPGYQPLHIIVSADSHLSKYPSSRTAKLYRIGQKELERILQSATYYKIEKGKLAVSLRR